MRLPVQQAGRTFNQAHFDKQYEQRSRQCIEKQKSDEEALLYRTGVMDQAREEFLLGTNRKYVAGRLRDKVKAQLTLHEFELEDRRDKYVDTNVIITHSQ